MSIIPFLLFPTFFIPTLIMVRKVFRNDEFKYAGYVMALVSAATTTLMLSNPAGFLNSAFSFGILPTIMTILFAGFCLIPVGAFIIMLFVGLKERFRLHLMTDHFNGIPEVQVNDQWIPETPRYENRDKLGISEEGRQQIARLIQAQKKTDEEENEESGYIFISSGGGEG